MVSDLKKNALLLLTVTLLPINIVTAQPSTPTKAVTKKPDFITAPSGVAPTPRSADIINTAPKSNPTPRAEVLTSPKNIEVTPRASDVISAPTDDTAAPTNVIKGTEDVESPPSAPTAETIRSLEDAEKLE